MKIPLYWARATVEKTDPRGKPVSMSCWRGSSFSQSDAEAEAKAAAARLVDRLIRGEELEHYGYGQGTLREEVIERFGEPAEPWAAVTRNASGVLVLNVARVMFIDLDMPPVSTVETLRSFVARLWKGTPPQAKVDREAEIVARLEAFVAQHSDWNVRLYRTQAGLRGLVTHAPFDPAADDSLAAMRELGADPLYVRLCQRQQCFRARLTPKPWRCGHHANTVPWPRETAEAHERFETWRQGYTARQAAFATCRFIAAYGSGLVAPEAETIIEVHDKLTRAHESLVLA
jgi:hypothetical protein